MEGCIDWLIDWLVYNANLFSYIVALEEWMTVTMTVESNCVYLDSVIWDRI